MKTKRGDSLPQRCVCPLLIRRTVRESVVALTDPVRERERLVY